MRPAKPTTGGPTFGGDEFQNGIFIRSDLKRALAQAFVAELEVDHIALPHRLRPHGQVRVELDVTPDAEAVQRYLDPVLVCQRNNKSAPCPQENQGHTHTQKKFTRHG